MSDEFELLVLGGGPAGLAAARAYRNEGGRGAVAIVTEEHRMPYNRPPLTKDLLRGESSEDELPIESEAWLREQTVALVSGRAVDLDLRRSTELAGGAVPVDAAMRTEQAGLYAAGDVAFAENVAAGRALRVEHWGDALGQGEVAGRRAAGEPAQWDAVPGFWSTIGSHTLKYAAWGDGFEQSRLEQHGGGAFTTWYGREGTIVGVLAHEADEDYERGRALIAEAAPWR